MTFWAVATIINSLDNGRRAERGLDRLGYQYYNPRTEEQWVVRGRKIVRPVQLFPGYLFVKIVEQWHKLINSIDVTGIIRDGNGPLKISESLINQFRTDEAGGAYRLPAPGDRFQPGQAVFLTTKAGAYVDRVVSFDGMSGPDRCAVLMQMLGRQVRVTVDLDALTEVI